MYIPLDNLYDWISGNILDTLIYRFYPPGEKNLANLTVLDNCVLDTDARKLLTQVPVICHDQEPLNFDLYKLSWQQLRQMRCETQPWNQDFEILYHNSEWWQWWADQNLASVVLPNMSDRVVLLHSEKNSAEVEKFNKLAVPAYWWSHGVIARDWYRFAEHDNRLKRSSDHEFELDFNIYARAWQGTREYRLTFLSLLVEQQLESHSRITFSHHDHSTHYTDHVFVNQSLATKTQLHHLSSNQISSDSSATYDPLHYSQCAVDIVLETLFDDTRWHLTEKILRPIACGQPFILAATPGSLQYLRSYGFKTFDGLIDETYDTVQDPHLRLKTIITEMSRIAQLDIKSKKDLWRHLHAIAQYNKQRFFSKEFAQQLESELITNLNTAVQQVQQHYQTGQGWARQRRLMTYEQRENCLKVSEETYPNIRTDMAWALRSCR